MYDVIIGLEIHTALKTKSKMFCSCDNAEASQPNTNVCPICLGHPGTLPSVNKSAVESTVLLGLALNCKINKHSKFDRKNYFYPDLPKGYQISQYDLPLAYQGKLKAGNRSVAITRIHLEEDTGKLTHPPIEDYSLVDYNRAGTPLVEMVTEPVIPDAATAKAFCQRYQLILRYLDISNADMEKGEMRCEANVSVQKNGTWKYEKGEIKPIGKAKLNPKVEVKNINSFRSLEKAIEFEIKRQSEVLDSGGQIKAETRGWQDSKNETVSQRVKETSADYRYFPEPDIPPLSITPAWLKDIQSRLVEMPDEKIARLRDEYSISEYDATVLAGDKALAGYAEHVVSELAAWVEADGDSWDRHDKTMPKLAINWLINDFSRLLGIFKRTPATSKVSAENFAEFVYIVYKGEINSSAAQTLLEALFKDGGEPRQLMMKLGLKQIDDESILEKAVEKIIAARPDQAAQYRSGKTNLIQFFIGQVMAETKGKANPEKVKKLLEEKLK